MPLCSVKFCANSSNAEKFWKNSEKRLSWHSFPLKTDPTRRELWLNICEKSNYSSSMKICSDHFKEEDFLDFSAKKRFLKPNAVPTTQDISKDKMKCPVKFCTNSPSRISDNSENRLSWHSFPLKTDPIRRELWLRICEKSNYSGCMRICSNHFKEKDYFDFSAKKRALKPNAVPIVIKYLPNFQDISKENANTEKLHNHPDNYENKQKYFKVEEMHMKCPVRALKQKTVPMSIEDVNNKKLHNPPDNSENKQEYFKVEEMPNKCPAGDLKPTQFQDISKEDVNTTNNLSSEDTITPVKASVVIWIP